MSVQCAKRPPCGEVHERCSGHRNDGMPCGRWPKAGAKSCRRHGSGTKAAKAKAAERVADAEAEKAVRRLLHDTDAPPVQHPVVLLQVLAGRLAAAVDSLGEKVNEYERLGYASATGTEQLKSEVAVWERLQALLARVVTDLAKLNLDERRVRIEEAELVAILATLDRVFGRLELSDAQWALVRVVVPEEFLAIAGGDG